jgi:hypothetical protein
VQYYVVKLKGIKHSLSTEHTGPRPALAIADPQRASGSAGSARASRPPERGGAVLLHDSTLFSFAFWMRGECRCPLLVTRRLVLDDAPPELI